MPKTQEVDENGELRRKKPESLDSKILDALIEEYKILKSEASGTTEAGARAISYIQVFGVFILLFAGAYYGGLRLFLSQNQRTTIPQSMWFLAIACASMFLFLLYSHLTHTSFKLRVLRERMAQLEAKINLLAKAELYRYELQIAGRCFSHVALSRSLIAPNAWTRSFTFCLFGLAVCILLVLSKDIFHNASADYLLFVSGTILFVGSALLVDDIRVNKMLDVGYLANSPSPNALAAVVPYIGNYIGFMLIFYTLFAQTLASPSHSILVSTIDNTFNLLSSVGAPAALAVVFVYDALCGSVLFTPSELPLKLVDEVGLFPIIVAASLGKALGAVVLFITSRWWLHRGLAEPLRRFNESATALLTKFSQHVPLGFVYLLSQSIPFAPMRSATIAYAAVSPKGRNALFVVGAGSAVGTASRMLFIWWLIGIGT
jgi:hypothetical protein